VLLKIVPKAAYDMYFFIVHCMEKIDPWEIRKARTEILLWLSELLIEGCRNFGFNFLFNKPA
jgi:hypothetical protein